MFYCAGKTKQETQADNQVSRAFPTLTASHVIPCSLLTHVFIVAVHGNPYGGATPRTGLAQRKPLGPAASEVDSEKAAGGADAAGR